MSTPALSTKATGAMSGRQYLESLRDGREVWYRGERVRDVTTHPAFAGICRTLADLYDKQHDPATRDLMTFRTPEGLRVSTSYLLPRSPEELAARRRNTEFWIKETYGMVGRLPDFCAAMVIGLHDVADELGKVQPDFRTNALAYYKFARDNDLSISHALHDPAMDKSLRPEQDPDRCLRIVRETAEGVIVRGARFSTLAPVTKEIFVAPTYPLNEREGAHAIWFTLPIATTGVRLVCRESYSAAIDSFDGPLSSRFDEQDTLVIFDDVLVPWDRVFIARAPAEAMRLFRGRVMAWASICSILQLLGRLDLMIGVGHLLLETAGMSKRAHLTAELGEMVTYTELLRGSLRGAEADYCTTPGGLVTTAPLLALRAFVPMISERLVNILEHCGASSLIFNPTREDFAAPALRPLLDLYGRGKESSALDRTRLCKLAWELTGGAFGSRQQLYERLHAGDPAAIIERVYQSYNKGHAIAQVKRLLALADATSSSHA